LVFGLASNTLRMWLFPLENLFISCYPDLPADIFAERPPQYFKEWFSTKRALVVFFPVSQEGI